MPPTKSPYVIGRTNPTTPLFQYVHVPDIIRLGAFNAVVAGVVAVMPLASPVSAEFKGLDAFVGLAVKSATLLSDSATKL
jgi:hypothetical protein